MQSKLHARGKRIIQFRRLDAKLEIAGWEEAREVVDSSSLEVS